MNNFIAKVFPQSHLRNIALFYVLSAVYNAWFVAAVWVFIWGAFMTKTQMGISDSITFTIGFLVELPSGVMADLMGRRKAILIGNILLVTGNLLISASSSFFAFTLWYLVWTIGYAFQSGATEALAYDSLKLKKLESHWNDVITTATIIGRVTTLIATSLGGLLYIVGFRLPYLVAGFTGMIGIISAFYLQEIKVKQIENWSVKAYLHQIKDGLTTLIKPHIVPIAGIGLTVISVGYMYNWGILRPLTAERFGYNPTSYAFLLSLISLAVIVSMSLLKHLKGVIYLPLQILLTCLVYGLIFFMTGFSHSFIIGGLLMIGLAIGLTQTEILFSQFINEHTQSQHRATTLSAVALLTRLPYILLVVLIGKIAENNGLPLYTSIVGAVVIVIALFTAIIGIKRRLFQKTL
jgi:MFS family permease